MVNSVDVLTWAWLFFCAVYYAVEEGSSFCVCGWNPPVWPFKWKLLSNAFLYPVESVVLSFQSVKKMLRCDFSNDSDWALLFNFHDLETEIYRLKGVLSWQFCCFLVKFSVEIITQNLLFKTRNTSATTRGRYHARDSPRESKPVFFFWRYFPLTMTKL